MEQFIGFFNLPGEGFVAQLRNQSGTALYDRQGLQHLILQRKQAMEDSAAAEQALAQMKSLQDQVDFIGTDLIETQD